MSLSLKHASGWSVRAESRAQTSWCSLGAQFLSQLPTLLPGLSRAEGAEFRSLSRETQPEILVTYLLNFGTRLAQAGKAGIAAELFASFLNFAKQAEVSSAPFRHLLVPMERRLKALLGQGSNALRAEVLLRSFAETATDFKMIVPMMAGSLVYRALRAGMATRLALSSSANLITRGVGARLVAGMTGFAGELPAFVLSSRALSALSGDSHSGESASLGKDLTLAVLTLAALKLSVLAGQKVHQLSRGLDVPLASWSRTALPAVSMMLGMSAAHLLAEASGLRPPVDDATTFLDSIAALVGLGVGAHLGGRIFGSPSLDLRENTPERRPFPGFAPIAETAGKGRETFLGSPIIKMSDQNGNEGGSGKPKYPVLDFGNKKLETDLKKLLRPQHEEVEEKSAEPENPETPPVNNVLRLTPKPPSPESRDTETRLRLEANLERPSLESRKLNIILLGRLGDPAARPALEKMLDDPHPHVKILALGALALLGDIPARARLSREFNDADQKGKIFIIGAWRDLGDDEARAALQKALKYPDGLVQRAAAASLDILNPPPPEPEFPKTAEEIPLPDLVVHVLFQSDRVAPPQALELAERVRAKARESSIAVKGDEMLRLAEGGLENISNVGPARKLSAALRLSDALVEDSLSFPQKKKLVPILLRALEPLDQLAFALDIYEKLHTLSSLTQGAKLLDLILSELHPKAHLTLEWKRDADR